jgi:hypothetical protein
MNDLKSEVLPIEIELEGVHYSGEAVAMGNGKENMPSRFSVILNHKIFVHIECVGAEWHAVENDDIPQEVVDAIGDYLYEYYN